MLQRPGSHGDQLTQHTSDRLTNYNLHDRLQTLQGEHTQNPARHQQIRPMQGIDARDMTRKAHHPSHVFYLLHARKAILHPSRIFHVTCDILGSQGMREIRLACIVDVKRLDRPAKELGWVVRVVFSMRKVSFRSLLSPNHVLTNGPRYCVPTWVRAPIWA